MNSLRSEGHQLLIKELKQARLDAGLTQAQLADRLRKPQSYVAKIEIGERKIDVLEFVSWLAASDQFDRAINILSALKNNNS